MDTFSIFILIFIGIFVISNVIDVIWNISVNNKWRKKFNEELKKLKN